METTSLWQFERRVSATSDDDNVVTLVVFQKLIMEDNSRCQGTPAGRSPVLWQTDVIVVKIVGLGVDEVRFGDLHITRHNPRRFVPPYELIKACSSEFENEIRNRISETLSTLPCFFRQRRTGFDSGYRSFGVLKDRRD